MIDPKLNEIYNICLSLFIGILIAIILLFLYDLPRTIVIDSYNNIKIKNKCNTHK
jgi:hypothetical protein